MHEEPDRHAEPLAANEAAISCQQHHDGHHCDRSQQCVQKPWTPDQPFDRGQNAAEHYQAIVDRRRREHHQDGGKRKTEEPEEHVERRPSDELGNQPTTVDAEIERSSG